MLVVCLRCKGIMRPVEFDYGHQMMMMVPGGVEVYYHQQVAFCDSGPFFLPQTELELGRKWMPWTPKALGNVFVRVWVSKCACLVNCGGHFFGDRSIAKIVSCARCLSLPFLLCSPTALQLKRAHEHTKSCFQISVKSHFALLRVFHAAA